MAIRQFKQKYTGFVLVTKQGSKALISACAVAVEEAMKA